MELTGLKDISPEFVPDEEKDNNEMDTTNRYDNEFPDEDMFEQIVRNAEEAEREKERSKGKIIVMGSGSKSRVRVTIFGFLSGLVNYSRIFR